MRRISLVLLLLATALLPLQAQYAFSKYFEIQANFNLAMNSTHQLKNHGGYLVLADQYNSPNSSRNTLLIKTDTLLNAVWGARLSFLQSPAPFSNLYCTQAGELLNGNYFVFGETADTSGAYSIVFVLDTNGNLLHYTALHDTQSTASMGNFGQVHIGFDSSIVVAVSDYDRFGVYRLDQNLNLLSSTFFTDTNGSWGRDAMLLPDTTLLITGPQLLVKASLNGNIIWANSYNTLGHTKCIYASPSGKIFFGGYANINGTQDFLAGLDANGNPLFIRYYAMSNSNATSAVWNIYPDGNHLMLYSDSVMFPVDTLGNPTGPSWTLNSYNTKFMNLSADPGWYLVTGIIYQDTALAYEFSVLKFSDNITNGCLQPRPLTVTSPSLTATPVTPTLLPVNIQSQAFFFQDTVLLPNYIVRNGCPPDAVGIEETAAEIPLVYPNPATDQLTIHFPHNEASNLRLSIIDYSGREVYSGTMSSETETVNTSEFAAGLYFLRLESNGVMLGKSSFAVVR